MQIAPKHTKTMLNIGVVRAFGKQDLNGAASIWQQVVDLAPESAEGRAAKRMIEAVRSAHPDTPTSAAPGCAAGPAAGQRRLVMWRWILNAIVLLLLMRLALRFVLGLFQGLAEPAQRRRARRDPRAVARQDRRRAGAGSGVRDLRPARERDCRQRRWRDALLLLGSLPRQGRRFASSTLKGRAAHG